MQNNDVTVRRKSYAAAKEIKASAHYAYVVNGITLDGTKFDAAGYVEEGTCLGKNADGKYEKWADAGLTDPVILDESVKFTLTDEGANPDVTVGQVIVHGAVYESMLVGVTDAFKTAVGAAIRFV
ncbi:hypothetical protein [Blautia producta]|uniref:hypothetical protein n=1 Tax=Blautia producta TaxID=33035 RepID=UPI0031B5D006